MKPRFIIFCAVLLAIFTLALGSRLSAVMSPEQPDRYSIHRVKAGETLWVISEKYLRDVDPRTGAEWIRRVNGMPDNYVVRPGDVLNVPDRKGELTEPVGPVSSSMEAARKAEAAMQRVIQEAEAQAQEEERQAARKAEEAVARVMWGTKEATSRGAGYRELVMEATAFTAGPESTGKAPGHPEYGIMFSGLEADRGAVAVDPAVIPLGSVVWVEGYGYAVALDTGSDIKGQRIDVFIADVAKAREWGRRQVKVRILGEGK